MSPAYDSYTYANKLLEFSKLTTSAVPDSFLIS